ncbi:MAG: DUF411 domain-containing protein [Gammaproteobacteria bacterium]|nr:DUF411 domain-containing protein [Gammaproteobacteria bacterium]
MRTRKSTTDSRRRQFIGALLCSPLLIGLGSAGRAAAANLSIKVWKSPTCGCCKDWIKHLEANGFSVTYYDEGNSDARKRLRMPIRFGSCHTAEIEGYAIEGHVPAREILRLLDEQPEAIGLAVPAMPRGSPGMDGPAYGGVTDPYDVLLIAPDGAARVFQSYR